MLVQIFTDELSAGQAFDPGKPKIPFKQSENKLGFTSITGITLLEKEIICFKYHPAAPSNLYSKLYPNFTYNRSYTSSLGIQADISSLIKTN